MHIIKMIIKESGKSFKIILTGGLAHSGKWILNPTIKSFNKNLLPFYQNKVKILLSGLEDKDSAILGSAALVWKKI